MSKFNFKIHHQSWVKMVDLSTFAHSQQSQAPTMGRRLGEAPRGDLKVPIARPSTRKAFILASEWSSHSSCGVVCVCVCVWVGRVGAMLCLVLLRGAVPFMVA
jgi:hypothetical protein